MPHLEQLLLEKDQLLACQAQELAVFKEENAKLKEDVAQLQQQIAFFQRQFFGRKSEKLEFALKPIDANDPPEDGNDATQASSNDTETTAPRPKHQKAKLPGTPANCGLRFDEKVVPLKTIILSAPELEGPDAANYTIIRYEETYKLAQTPASYHVILYKRPVLLHGPTQKLTTVPAPDTVFGKSVADVSFVVGMLVDKFVYHLPLYRQQLRMKAMSILISRATLTNLVERAALLLEPIANAILQSILESQLIAMDETPTRAGRKKKPGAKHGMMRTGWYWPLYGDRDEIYFHFAPSREHAVATEVLAGFAGTLLSDGYAAYKQYAAAVKDCTQALRWVHNRRYFERSLDDDPELAQEALAMIGALFAHEEKIRSNKLEGADKLAYRQKHSQPIVDRFFEWCAGLVDKPELIATKSPLLKAIKYALKREPGLRTFLADPTVPIDTNHLERALRVIPMGKKNWLFSWTELGAKYVGIIQTLICSCRLQDIDPFTYLVDVLQRIDRHPASQVRDLIPRNWKKLFGDSPLQSDLAAA